MKLKLPKLTIITCLLFWSICSHGAITCTAPMSTGFSTAYASSGVVPNVTQGTVTVNCTRSASGDATNLLLRANNGLSLCLGSNSGGLLISCIAYEAYRDSGCNLIWTNDTDASAIPIMLSSVLTPQSITVNFWGCITMAGQSPASGSGSYSDAVIMSVRDTGGLVTYSTSSFPVNILYPATCAITSLANVAFGTYVAFSATPLIAPNANIVLNCTSNLPYSLALDTTSGVVAGLKYSLSLDSTSSRGMGPGQIHTITGTMPANQAGTCSTSSCSGSDTRTLTITY